MTKKSEATKNRMSRLLLEYLKDSSRSDRELAKVLGVSQPTISRMKRRLLTEGLVRHFSAIPDFGKMGYEIMAFSCVKFKMEELKEIQEKAKEWAQNPSILFTSRAQGMGMDAVTISLHKNYVEYTKFLEKNKEIWGHLMHDVHFMLVDLKGDITKPFSLKYLAEQQQT